MDRLPPVKPSKMRAANTIGRLFAKPISTKPANVPSCEMTSSGLRPKRSDSLPNTGAPISCIAEYDAVKSPIASGLAPNDMAKVGSSGMINPKPTKSINTTKKMGIKRLFICKPRRELMEQAEKRLGLGQNLRAQLVAANQQPERVS